MEAKLKWYERMTGVENDDTHIRGFFDDYRWLSNYHSCRVMYRGLIFNSSEAAYQAAKSEDPKEWLRFSTMDAHKSKKEGRKLRIREDWDQIKDEMMRSLLFDKFFRNKDLREKLIATGEKHLEETNWWGDTYWGVCDGQGMNRLGEELMHIRSVMKVIDPFFKNGILKEENNEQFTKSFQEDES